LVAQHDPPEIVRRSLRFAGGCEESPAIGLQEPNPGVDIARVPHIAINREFGTKESGAKLGDLS
jgi:hypothetical protein